VTLAAGVGESFARTVTDGPLAVAALVSAFVGLLSFLSPCVLPLVPGYLSYVTGLAGADEVAAASRPVPVPAVRTGSAVAVESTVEAPGRARFWLRGGRTMAGAALFVLGFTAVFVAYGTLFGTLGGQLSRHEDLIQRVLGAVVVLLGLGFMGLIPGLQRELRVRRLPAAGLAGAPVLGIVFGFGWTPCVGPTLGAVQTLAYSSASAGRGAFLAAAYCLGLGLPFLLAAGGARWLVGAFGAVRRHARWVTWVGGGLLVVLGLLLLTGMWDRLMIDFQSWVGNAGLGASL
jgi:cytochrome c-type biogenesis protein